MAAMPCSACKGSKNPAGHIAKGRSEGVSDRVVYDAANVQKMSMTSPESVMAVMHEQWVRPSILTGADSACCPMIMHRKCSWHLATQIRRLACNLALSIGMWGCPWFAVLAFEYTQGQVLSEHNSELAHQ